MISAVCAGCSDEAAILNIEATSAATNAMEAYCVAIGADGERRFGRRYTTGMEPLPQTLAIDPAGRKAADVRVDGIVGGRRAFYASLPVAFPPAAPLLASLDVCTPHAPRTLALRTPISFAADRIAVLRTGAEAAGTAELVALAGTSVARFTFSDGGMMMEPAIPGDTSDAVTALLSTDMDGDCADDLVVATTSQGPAGWIAGTDGAPAADPKRIDVVPPANALALADLNGDGIIDFVSANGGDGGAVFQGDGRGFSEKVGALDVQPTGSQAVAAGDLDGDDLVDLVYGFLNGPSIWLRNDGRGHFLVQSSLPGMSDTRAVVVLDVDGDGALDIIAATHDQGLRVFANQGGGTFDDVSVTSVPTGIDQALVGLVRADVDGDCVDDLIVLPQSSPPRWLRVENGTLVDHGALGTTPAHDAVAANIDGDAAGTIEVLIATANQIEILGAMP